MAVCVAIIGKDNAPLLLRCSNSPSGDNRRELKLHYTVHSSLDIIEEKLQQPATSGRSADLRELYLGLLLSSEDYKVFGYATNTRVKFVVVTELGSSSLKDQDIRSVFKRLHNVFCDTMANPFYVPGSVLQSQSLDAVVGEILVH